MGLGSRPIACSDLQYIMQPSAHIDVLVECCVCVPNVSACTSRRKNTPTCSTSAGAEPLVECQRFIASGAWNPPCNSRGCCALHRHQCKTLWKDITCSCRPDSLSFLSQAEIILQTGGDSETLIFLVLIFFSAAVLLGAYKLKGAQISRGKSLLD